MVKPKMLGIVFLSTLPNLPRAFMGLEILNVSRYVGVVIKHCGIEFN